MPSGEASVDEWEEPRAPQGITMNQLLVFVGFFGLCGGTVFIGVLLSHINALLFLNNVKSSWVGTRCEVINKQWRYACANATDEHWVNDTDTTSCSSITGSRLLVAFNDSKEISKNAIMWDFPWSLYDTNQDKAKSKMFLHSFTLGQRKECYFDPAHPSEDSKVVLKEQWVGFDKKVSQEFFVFLGLACLLLLIPVACFIIWYLRKRRENLQVKFTPLSQKRQQAQIQNREQEYQYQQEQLSDEEGSYSSDIDIVDVDEIYVVSSGDETPEFSSDSI